MIVMFLLEDKLKILASLYCQRIEGSRCTGNMIEAKRSMCAHMQLWIERGLDGEEQGTKEFTV